MVSALTILVACRQDFVLDADLTTAAAGVASEVDGERLVQSVEDVVAAHQSETPLACEADDASDILCNLTHTAAAALIEDRLAALGYDVKQQKTRDGSYDVVNLVVEVPGVSTETVLVSAHYDAGFAAADDDSTGVATLLELARILAGTTPARTIRLVAFDLEELGMVGATAYVRELDDDPSIAAVIDVDGIGVATPAQPSAFGIRLPDTGDFLAVVGNADSAEIAATADALGRELDLVDVEGVVAGGDGTAPLFGLLGLSSGNHAPFWVAGIPAILVSDTQPIRDPAYHSADDTVEHLDAQFFTASARVVTATVAYLAEVGP